MKKKDKKITSVISTTKHKKKTPPPKAIKSVQFDLFNQFLSNDESKISNTVELWESIPKYFFTPKQVDKLRTTDGLANPYEWEYSYNGIPCAVRIQPALIKQKDGSYKAFFPGISEELTEEALTKILTEQQYGLHDVDMVETWLRFSLSMIQKKLKDRGHTRDRNEIKHTIEVMSSCILTLYKDGKEIWKGSILQDLVTIGRDEYLADTDAQHIARLPLFISQGINHLEYRQFNYERLMECDGQLTRWIYKQLIHRFKQASPIDDYHFTYSSLCCESALLQQANEGDNRKKVVSALDELVTQKILNRYTKETEKEGRKIVDVTYTLFPTMDFVMEQKAANKRAKDNQINAQNHGLFITQ